MASATAGAIGLYGISTLQVGQYVLSRPENDPEAPLEYKKITAVHVTTLTHLRILTVQDAQGNVFQLQSTNEHPFWVQGRGWSNADTLVVGEQFLGADGQSLTLIATRYEAHPEGIRVYNLEVEGDHTYLVTDAAGQEAVWVHNGKCGAWDAARKSYWKSIATVEHFLQSGKYSQENLRRMARGLAPQMLVLIKKGGLTIPAVVSMELHHMDIPQRTKFLIAHMKCNLKMVTPWEHEALDSFRHTGSTLVAIIEDLANFK